MGTNDIDSKVEAKIEKCKGDLIVHLETYVQKTLENHEKNEKQLYDSLRGDFNNMGKTIEKMRDKVHNTNDKITTYHLDVLSAITKQKEERHEEIRKKDDSILSIEKRYGVLKGIGIAFTFLLGSGIFITIIEKL